MIDLDQQPQLAKRIYLELQLVNSLEEGFCEMTEVK